MTTKPISNKIDESHLDELPQRFGLHGTVVPPGDENGVPVGYKHHKPHIDVVVNPDSADRFVVDMTKVTKTAVQQVVDNAMNGDTSAVNILRAFAEQPTQPVQQEVSSGAPPLSRVPEEMRAVRAGSPVQLTQRAPIVTPTATTEMPVAAPFTDMLPKFQVRLQREKDFVVHDGWYHQIIRHGAYIALIFDRRATGYSRLRFQQIAEDIVMHLAGANVLYIVNMIVVDFPIEHNDVCIFVIKEEHPYTPQ